MKRTGPTNPYTLELITECKKVASDKKIPLFKRIATELEKPTRKRRSVNISRINRYSQDKDTVVVPGSVLGSGSLDKKLSIYALRFSDTAVQKITQSGSKAIALSELPKKYKAGTKVRIMG